MWDGQILTRKGLQYEDSTRTTFVRPVYDRTGLNGGRDLRHICDCFKIKFLEFLHKPERLGITYSILQRCIKVGYLDEPWQGTLISQAHFQVSRSLLANAFSRFLVVCWFKKSSLALVRTFWSDGILWEHNDNIKDFTCFRKLLHEHIACPLTRHNRSAPTSTSPLKALERWDSSIKASNTKSQGTNMWTYILIQL